MPNLTAHIDFALECATRFSHQVVEDNLGTFLLGSCSPDIRIVTHGHRDNTHFAPISNDVLGAGMVNMLKAHPSLSVAKNLSERTQAFMAGYITHLIADEAWIIKIYRPYFGNRAIFEDEMTANIMDRAVQLDLDRSAADRHNGFERVTPILVDADEGVDVEFLDHTVLAEFRQRVEDATRREFTWERILFMARRQYPLQNDAAQTITQQFLDGLPHSLDRIYERVPRKAIQDFRETILHLWQKAMAEYLP